MNAFKKILELHWILLSGFLYKPAKSKDSTTFQYGHGNLLLPFILIVTLTAPLEFFLFYLIIPSAYEWIRTVLVFLSVEVLVLSWGLFLSIKRFPHIINEDGIIFRWGNLVSFFIPYSLIQNIEKRKENEPNGYFGVTFHPDHPRAFLSNSANTNVAIFLKQLCTIPAWLTPVKPVNQINIDIEDPDNFVDVVDHKMHLNQNAGAQDIQSLSGSISSSGLSTKTLVWLSMAMEIPLFLIGIFWMQKQGIIFSQSLQLSLYSLIWGAIIGLIGALLTIVGLSFSSKLPFLVPWRDWFVKTLSPFLGKTNMFALIIVAVLAGIGEEVFFRGALQPVIGIFPTALIFAVVHIGMPRREAIPFFIYVFLYGISFCILRNFGFSLFSLIIAHSLIDTIVSIFITRNNHD